MGINSKIEWTDHTFNPWRGCEHSQLADGTTHPGCEHCYAEAMSGRNPSALGQWGSLEEGGKRVKASDEMWRQPVKWNLAAAAAGVRARVFCASLADVFEDWTAPVHDHHGDLLGYDHETGEFFKIVDPRTTYRATLRDLRTKLFRLIDGTPWLDWLLLTKRPGNIRKMWRPIAGGCDGECCEYRSNVWLITSVSNQATADELIPELLRCRDLVPVLGLSAEPLLGPIDLRARPPELRGTCLVDHRHDGTQGSCQTRGLDWIIVGGESGHHARPMHPDWARSIRDQCQAAGVAFFFKQWGEYTCHEGIAGPVENTVQWEPPIPAAAFAWQRLLAWSEEVGQFQRPSPDATVSQVLTAGAVLAAKVGKHAAGRELDGCEWGEFPQVQQHQGAV
jgi:protein gp37